MSEETYNSTQEITIKIHPAGCFDKKTGFVCEPLGDRNYIFKYNGIKGTGKAELTEKIECPTCGTILSYTGKRKILRCSCGKVINDLSPKWKLLIDDEIIKVNDNLNNLSLEFTDEPLEKVIFKVPEKDALNYWLNTCLFDSRTKKEIDSKYIFELLKKYFLTYYDFPSPERDSNILAFAVLQSWLTEIIDILFYIAIPGEMGGGKTAVGEGTMGLCRHGFMASDISSTAIARCIEKFKLSMFFDEIDDKKNDNAEDISGVLRKGYKRGNPFVKLNPKTFEPETFESFGFKGYAYRSDVKDDLHNRSIDINMSKSTDKRIPVLNMFKGIDSPFDILFFWYLDNVKEIYVNHPNFISETDIASESKEVNAVNIVNKVKVNSYNAINESIKENVEEIRKGLVTGIRFLPNLINRINQKNISGRNIEILYIIFSLSEMLKIDIQDLMISILEDKQEQEKANDEEGWVGILREVLIKCYNEIPPLEEIKSLTYNKVASLFNSKIKDEYNNVPSQYQTKRFMRQLGFVDGINKKVMKKEGKAHLCLIFDIEIKKKLGIIQDSEVSP